MWNLDQKPLDQLAFAIWSENIVFHKDDVLSGENMVFVNTKLNFYFDGLGIYIIYSLEYWHDDDYLVIWL